jgi:hypothetical protein
VLPKDDLTKAVYFEAIDTAESEGFFDEAFDFAGWVVEQELSGERQEEPLLNMLRRFNIERLDRAADRVRLKYRIEKLCGQLGEGDLDRPSEVLLNADLVARLAKEGRPRVEVAQILRITPQAAERALAAIKEDPHSAFIKVRL